MHIPTSRQRSRLAEIESHQLLLRAGFIKPAGPGLWNGLPMYAVTMRRLQRLVHKYMADIHALEVTIGGLEPLDTMDASQPLTSATPDGRKYRLTHKPEHEIASLMDRTASAYGGAAALAVFAFASRFSAEPKSRFGLLQARRFDSLEVSVFASGADSGKSTETKLVETASKLLAEMNLPVVLSEGDEGHRWFLPLDSKAGFSEVLSAGGRVSDPDIAAIAAPSDQAPEPAAEIEKVSTPDATTIRQISAMLNADPRQIVKTIICVADSEPLAVLVRGDRELSLPKLKRVSAAGHVELAGPERIMEITGAPVGFAGPVGLGDVSIWADHLVKPMADFVVGANEDQAHYVNVNHRRDFQVAEWADLTVAESGDRNPEGEKWSRVTGLSLARLRRLSQPPEDDSDRDAEECSQVHLSIGLSRLIQAVVEYAHDDKGILWPLRLAPYVVAIMPLKADSEEHMKVAGEIYNELTRAGIPVAVDDRPLRPGQKFAEAELIGYPVRVIVGDKSLKEGSVEIQYRAGGEARMVSLEQVAGLLIKDLADTTL